MVAHAYLSASNSKQWLMCTPSIKLSEGIPNQESDFAREGTLAHEFSEAILMKNLGIIKKQKYNAIVKKIKANELYAADMDDYVERYVDIVMEKIGEANSPEAVHKVEQRLDFSAWVPRGFGTGDAVIIDNGIIEIIDLKYGKGVPVSAIGNTQIRLYALGAINEFGFFYDIEKVKMTIVQPRLDSVSTDEISAEELLKWADEYLKPRAELAIKGEGEFCAGDHCKFCRANAICRARAEKNMEIAKYEFANPPTLDNLEISHILDVASDFSKWIKDVESWALQQALQGEIYPGYKVVEGRSNRKWKDEDEVGKLLLANGFQENIIYTKKLDGIGKIEKAIGKKKTSELLGDLIVKPQGSPTLVVESDKRPVYNSAELDFRE